MSSNGSHVKNGDTNGYHGYHSNGATKGAVTGQQTHYPYGPMPPKVKAKKEGFLANYKKLKAASKRPLPSKSGDGQYLTAPRRPGLKDDIKRLTRRDAKTLLDIISAKLKGETQNDDKGMIMERTIQLVAGLSDHSTVQEVLTNDFIDKLWYSLDHPPLLYMGDEFRFRQPDGSNNNPYFPKLGAAKTPYARSCKPKVLQLGAQPDPEAIYEGVMARSTFKRNPNNVSSILWYWATIIIHDLFWTNMQDPNQNDSSSYLDLSPLYGSNKEQCDSIRTFKDGLIKPDTFADKRMIGNPPGVCIILIMFNRFHNHVATNMAELNEGGRFTKPAANLSEEAAAAAWKKYDEELFQTARLVTSGLYINITLVDYVRNIINLNRVDSTWTLDPRQEMGVGVGTKEGSEAGVGNVVSAEFNLCYRWHSCISEMDEKWIQDFYKSLLDGYEGPIDLQRMMMAVKKFEMSVAKDPAERTFDGFQRGPDGRFNDDELMEALSTAVEQPGGSFGGRNVPRVMKPVEMLGIIRGRKWNLAGLNEFRKHFGLKGYETFEDINSDPEIAENLRNLYQHPDNVELYPGIVAEEHKTPMVPGVGIAPTYTISRVVLSDAVSLVRGDRHYTTDYNPRYLTNWGFKEAEYELDVNHGCVFYKLFIRAFPHHFKSNSIYAHYPMVIPSENKEIMTSLNRAHLFDYDRPTYNAPAVNITSYGAARHILSSPDSFRVSWEETFAGLVGSGGRKFLLSDTSDLQEQQRKHLGALLYQDNWRTTIKSFYSMIAERLLAEKSFKIAGRSPQIDIIRDFGNLAHTHFVSRLFNLSLKTKENPKGVYSEQELYTLLSTIFISNFYDIDPVKSFPVRLKAKEAAIQLGGLLETNVKLATTLGLAGLFTKQVKGDPLANQGVNIAKGLKRAGLSNQDIVWNQILPTASILVSNQAQLFAHSIDFYLSPGADDYRTDLHRIALQESTEQTDALLLGYALEGIRLGGSYGIYRSATNSGSIPEDDGQSVNVQSGHKVFVSFNSAAKDARHFPDPDMVNPRRPVESYIWSGVGEQSSVDKEIGYVALTELFRSIFRRKGLTRAPGANGQLKKVPRPDGIFVYPTEDWGSLSPLPTSMKVTWDEE